MENNTNNEITNNRYIDKYKDELIVYLDLFPYNILNQIFEEDYDKIFNIPINKFLEEIGNLSPTAEPVINYIYKDGYTLKEVAEIFNLSTSRIGQIKKTSLRILKARCNRLLESYNTNKIIGEIINDKMNDDETIKKSLGYKDLHEKDFSDVKIINLNLSRRLFNCLSRAGYTSLLELSLIPPICYSGIRNLGISSFAELVYYLKNEFNIELPDITRKDYNDKYAKYGKHFYYIPGSNKDIMDRAFKLINKHHLNFQYDTNYIN